MSRVTSGLAQSSRATPGCPLRLLFLADVFPTLAFCPLDGGSDEFVGVFGGLPVRPSSSAMRASSALFCSTRSSIFASRDGQYQPLQIVGVERIDPLGRHPELESNGSDAFNAASLSHSAAGGE
jgi:hypothetical protein